MGQLAGASRRPQPTSPPLSTSYYISYDMGRSALNAWHAAGLSSKASVAEATTAALLQAGLSSQQVSRPA